MHLTFKCSIVALLLGIASTLGAQSTDFSVEGREVQVHGFASQSFMASNVNNYLTMNTSNGSFAFTDFGGNITVQVTDSFRVGAQIYDRNLGQLGKWRPQIDWASGDYRYRDWLGIRVGKIKTVLGLYNDTQDLESLHTWAIMPQSVYPLDLRATNIAHVGGDIYGDISLKRLGSLSYTTFAGLLPDDRYGGYFYGAKAYDSTLITLGARNEGADLRWNTPLQGFMAGASHIDANSDGRGIDPFGQPFNEHTKQYATDQFYVHYLRGGLIVDGEYRRTQLDQITLYSFAPIETKLDSRSFYGSVSYRISKWIEVGTYYSRFYVNWGSNHSDPGNHIFDKVASLRLDLNNHWDVKIEGHFMNGYGAEDAFQGFYLQENPQGFRPNTDLLVIRTGLQF